MPACSSVQAVAALGGQVSIPRVPTVMHRVGPLFPPVRQLTESITRQVSVAQRGARLRGSTMGCGGSRIGPQPDEASAKARPPDKAS